MPKKFLLITPLRILPLPLVPPLGPISIFSRAKALGFDGEFINFNEIINQENMEHYDDIVIDTIKDCLNANPEICLVGVSILFSGVFQRALEIAQIVKKIRSEIKVIVGGIHPTLHGREILENCQEIDFVSTGQGEKQFVSLLDILNDQDNGGLKEVAGLGFRQDGKIFVNEKAPYTADPKAAEIGRLDYSIIDFSKYHTPDMDSWYNPREHKIISAAPIITSFSCPYNCNFCSIHSVHGPRSTYRHRPVDDVLEELKFLYYEKEIRYFYVVDDCSTCNKKKALELFGRIADSGMKLSLEFQNGLNLRSLDDEVIDAIVAAGMIRGGLAIESGSEIIRNKVIGKGLSEERIFSVYKRFRKNHPHVWLVGFFILGLPEETLETLEQTKSLIERLEDIYPVFNAAVPTPGTRLWDQCVRDKLLLFDSTDAWKKSFIFGNKRDNDKANCWSMRGLEAIPDTFVVKPYDLSLDILAAYYQELQNLGAARLKKIKAALSQFNGKL